MKIKTLFDKETKDKKLHTGWGVSFLIDEKIIFDTGEKGSWLIENIKNLKIDINKIENVVISHEHWDHIGGLWELLKRKKGLKVYVCPNFSLGFKNKVKELKGKLIETEKFTEVSGNIFVTGEIAGEYKGEYMPEQALAAKTEKGLIIITGCSHPGIIKILEDVKNNFKKEDIYLVLGGFHLLDKDKRVIEFIVDEFKRLKVKKAGPTHCSGYEANKMFKSKYLKNFISVNVGEVIEI